MQAGRESLQRALPLENPFPSGDDATQRVKAEREGDIHVRKKTCRCVPSLPPLEVWLIASTAILRGQFNSFERSMVDFDNCFYCRLLSA
ncbi:hypothetical protein Poly59_60480 [Rubripirellula reticaptiva]|uniref:Uncharacterized protein n=1 Tax=Rubripirellula reticaptiva TaxID=2528013 RepID=A0A5C6EF46_9BACT|nr:hypothetical protein Poly59_60480 [Rubripirellula reticaptiva]